MFRRMTVMVASAGLLVGALVGFGSSAQALTITIPTQVIPTTTTVSFTTAGQQPGTMLATATVAPGLLVTPTGTVAFTVTDPSEGKSITITVPLSSGCVILVSSCKASLVVGRAPLVVVARYSGDQLALPSTGSAVGPAA